MIKTWGKGKEQIKSEVERIQNFHLKYICNCKSCTDHVMNLKNAEDYGYPW